MGVGIWNKSPWYEQLPRYECPFLQPMGAPKHFADAAENFPCSAAALQGGTNPRVRKVAAELLARATAWDDRREMARNSTLRPRISI